MRSAAVAAGCSALCGLLAACSLPPPPERAPPPPAPEAADAILVVEAVHPLEDGLPAAEAVAVAGGRILALSDRTGILRFRGPNTRIHTYPGAHLFPGFADAHGHLLGLGRALDRLDLRGVRSYGDLVAMVAARAAARPKGTWILGRGWDQTLWNPPVMPDHRALSDAVPDHPVLLWRVGGHAVLANAKAMELAGVGPDFAAPPGGEALRSADGALSGVFLDRAAAQLARAVPAREDRARLERRLLAAQARLLSVGLTRIHDAGTEPATAASLRRLERAGRWRLGVYGMWADPGRGDPPAPDDPGPRSLLRWRALKLYADGALGSRGAALLAPYADQQDTRGLLVTAPELLARRIERAAALGLQPCVHAIGDRANRLVLDLFERLLGPQGCAALRPRIEHAQVLAPADIPRFAALGVTASMQPTHLTTDMRWAPARLGRARLRGAYAFKTLLESGAAVCFGSDFPVEPVDPFRGVFAAVTTRPPEEPAAPPLRPDQRLERRQALLLFCRSPHRAAFEEGVRGRLRPGFEADFTIVDRDLERVPAEALLATQVLAVFVHGREVWNRATAAASASGER